jgi:two-component system, LytTR family, sensor kinase
MPMDKPEKQKNRKINLLFHLSVLVLAIVLDPPNTLDFEGIVKFIVTRVFLLGVFYTCYFWLVPNYLAKKKILMFIILLFVLLNLTPLIGYFTLEILHDINLESPIHLFYRWNMHFSGLFVITVASIFGIAFRSIFGWYEEMQNKSIIEQERLRNELLLLKAQINPHFLFNTLNSIDFLIYSNQSKASESLIKLSSILRYVIYDTVNDLVTLQKEIEQMEAYIDLQRLRFGEIGSVNYELTGDPSNRMIAPMLFMPFIENAFKHTDEAGIKKGLTIRFHIGENNLEFTCENYISLKENNLSGGFGLTNVRKRLEMQYPDNYNLSINQTGQVFTVALKLNLK